MGSGPRLDAVAVHAPDGVTHARVADVPILLCGRDVPRGSFEDPSGDGFDCPECRREADLRGDRSFGVVDA